MFPSPAHSHIRNASICANFAVLAYGHDAIQERVYRNFIYADNSVPNYWSRWKNNNAQGVAARINETAVIALAGTNDRFDILLDLDCGMVAAGDLAREHALECCGNDNTLFHRGFANYAMLSYNALQSIDFNLDGVKQIYCCGHSLGGAAATYLPWVLPHSHQVQVFSYGAPRCFGRKTIAPYPYQLMRIVRNTDPVPLVPRAAVSPSRRRPAAGHALPRRFVDAPKSIRTHDGNGPLGQSVALFFLQGQARPQRGELRRRPGAPPGSLNPERQFDDRS